MAEEGSVYELEGLEKQLQSLLRRYSSEGLRADSKPFCLDYCKLVEEYASCWQVPLPQLRIFEVALCCFARASTFFASNCDHVLHTLSSLALSVFELLLFFDQKDFHQEPLKHFTVTFQECHSALAKHQNVHLLQVERLVRGGGAWASSALQAILSDSSLPQNEVDECISSELPVFFELRVRYLLSCERLSEALALAKCCAQHPTAGQHLFFLQVYLTWLHKTSQHDRLHKEVADFSGKDAVHIICNLEGEEKDELLLALSRAFLSQQLRRGNMYYLCDLVFVWSKLHSRLKSSKQVLLEESRQLMLSATNVNSIFPFIRVILQELGDDGIQFCVELCANALESCLSCDVVTKSLIYKTIAGLLPNDLEVCRACALLVFFLERSVDTYKMVYLLYMQPDQDYNVEYSPIRNHIRFETLQVLKKGLYFDPEFWNLIALRTNCLKLMRGKVVDAALEEIMDEKWISKYCTKEAASRSRTSLCHKGSKGAAAKKRHHKEDRHPKEDITDMESKRLKLSHGKTRLNVDHALKKKGNQGSRHMKEASSEPLRRSFWQLDRIQDNVVVAYGEQRRTTRLSEKNPPKRRIRKPKWLLEDSGTLEENSVPPKFKKHGLKHGKHHRSSVVKGSESGQIKNNSKHKVANSHLKAKENNTKHQKGLDSRESACTPQIILELSLPDNELMGTFADDTCHKQRGYPQMLLYKPTVKLPATSQPVKALHRKEVILRARDATMFVQQLHCYTRRQKGKRTGSNIHGSVSTITRSSVQGSPPKDPTRELCESPNVEMKGGIASQTPAAAESSVLEKVLQKKTSARELFEKSAVEMKVATPAQTSAAQKVTETSILEKVPQAQTTEKVSQTISSARELCEESAVEMKVTIASQTPAGTKATQSSVIDKVSKAQNIKDVSKTTASAEVSQTSTAHNNRMVVTDEIPPNSSTANVSNTGEQAQSSLSSWCKGATNYVAHVKANTPEVVLKDSNGHSKDELKRDRADTGVQKGTIYGENIGTSCESTCVSTEADSIHDISALTLVTEMVTEFPPEELARDLENHKLPVPEDGAAKESTSVLKPNVPHKIRTTSSCSVPQQGASAVADMQGKKEYEGTDDSDSETVESEESKLEYNCIFCSKVFKGHRVVVHAMFHYRKDECMFCGTMFKDDLLAMMHLSDHIEKLKKIKAQENCVSETKDISTPKTSSKAKNTNVSSGLRSSGRQRKCTVRPNSLSNLESSPSESRKLRSRDKPADGQDLQEKEKNKHHDSKTPVHKVNGHVGKKKQLDRMKQSTTNSKTKQPLKQQEIKQERTSDGGLNPELVENHDLRVDSSTTSVQVKEEFDCSTEDTAKETASLQVLKTATKQNGQVVEEKNVDPQEKVFCPADGCTWFTDQSKNRVALLYHALDDHYGDVKPLQLSFQISNSRCSICMRVLWSFEHFQHHVERHRLAPRHPCLHQGCTARFKTGMEMRRHARRHSPLQAVCCLPGCSQLFICLWALNLHEREHYASKSTKPIKNTNVQTNDKHNNSLAEKKHDHKPKDSTAATTVKKTVSVKTARKLRGQAAHNSSTGKSVSVPPLSSVTSSQLKEEANETKDSNVLKNLSNKDTTAESAVPNLRLRQPLRKRQVAKTNLLAPKTHKVLSSLLKHKSKMRHKFKKQQVKVNTKDPKRRGRPPKSNKAVHDENTTTDRNNETVKKKTQPPASPSETAETSTVGNKLKVEEEKSQHVQGEVKTMETSTNESKSKKSVNKHVKQKVLHNKSAPAVTAKSLNQSVTTTSADKKQKLTADKGKKSHITKKRCAPDDSHTASLDSSKSKKQKVTNGNKTAKTVNKKCSQKELGVSTASKNPAKSKSETKATGAVESLADEERKADAENTNSTQNIPGNSFNETTLPHTTSGEKKQKLSKKENKSHAPKENITQTASSDSGKANKKHKVIIKKGDKKIVKERRPCKDPNKTSASKKTAKSKSVVQQAEAKTAAAGAGGVSCLNVEGKAKEETSDATLDSPGSSCVSAVTANVENETTPPQTSLEENKRKETTKKSQDVKKSEHKKAKAIKKEGDAKKKCPRKDEGTPSAPKKPKPKTQPKVKTEERAESEDDKSTVCIDTLAEYGKKPYMRLPPTAYLDEKFITMPKRRKEMLSFQSTQKSPPPEQANVTAAQQRQRCANCFATFNSAEELQSHLQLQSCSNLFGFDSDDEGNS